MPGYLTLVSEDLLSERIAQRMLAHCDPDAHFNNCIEKKGINYIENRLRNFNEAARSLRIFVLADRDKPENCPIELIRSWLRTDRRPNLVVRFAEMEVESWIIADRAGLSEYLNVPLTRAPNLPDSVPDPKREIVNIARHSRNRRIREDICPTSSSRSIVGPAYNSSLEKFVNTRWDLNAASEISPSLRRAEVSLRRLASH